MLVLEKGIADPIIYIIGVLVFVRGESGEKIVCRIVATLPVEPIMVRLTNISVRLYPWVLTSCITIEKTAA